ELEGDDVATADGRKGGGNRLLCYVSNPLRGGAAAHVNRGPAGVAVEQAGLGSIEHVDDLATDSGLVGKPVVLDHVRGTAWLVLAVCVEHLRLVGDSADGGLVGGAYEAVGVEAPEFFRHACAEERGGT